MQGVDANGWSPPVETCVASLQIKRLTWGAGASSLFCVGRINECALWREPYLGRDETPGELRLGTWRNGKGKNKRKAEKDREDWKKEEEAKNYGRGRWPCCEAVIPAS